MYLLKRQQLQSRLRQSKELQMINRMSILVIQSRCLNKVSCMHMRCFMCTCIVSQLIRHFRQITIQLMDRKRMSSKNIFRSESQLIITKILMSIISPNSKTIDFISSQVTNNHCLIHRLSNPRISQQITCLRHMNLLITLPTKHSSRSYLLLQTILIVSRIESRHLQSYPIHASPYQNRLSTLLGLLYILSIIQVIKWIDSLSR
jgi:hypothetical protein